MMMMKSNRKKAGIVAAALSSALLVGGGALAFADTGTPTPGSTTTGASTPGSTTTASPSQERDDTGSDNEGTEKEGTGAETKESGESTFAGTVKAPAENEAETEAADGRPEEKVQEDAEAAALAKLATVTQQQATKAATDLVPGTVSTIKLDDQDGFVVWEIDITKADGTMVEVLVDAGNAGNLAQETD